MAISPPYGGETARMGDTIAGRIVLVVLGSILWLLHGIAMLAAVGAPLALAPLEFAGGTLPSAESIDAIASGVIIAYGLAILFALAGSISFGGAALRAAEPLRRSLSTEAAALSFFVYAVLAGLGAIGYVALTLGLRAPRVDEDSAYASVLTLSACWLLASVVLVPAMIHSRAAFAGLRLTSSSPAGLRMTLPTLYSIVNLAGVLPFAAILMWKARLHVLFIVNSSSGVLSIAYESEFRFTAFIALIAGPVVAIVAFAHLLIRAYGVLHPVAFAVSDSRG